MRKIEFSVLKYVDNLDYFLETHKLKLNKGKYKFRALG